MKQELNQREFDKFRDGKTGTVTSVVIDETYPTDPLNNNPSLVLAYDGSGNLSTITKTIDGTDYQKTLTYDGSNNLTGVSAWSEV